MTQELPEGTVTVLFTDVVGSTGPRPVEAMRPRKKSRAASEPWCACR